MYEFCFSNFLCLQVGWNLLIQPTQIERSRKFICRVCSKSYINKDSLQRHINIECGKEPSLQCPACPYKTFHKFHLKTHAALKHKISLSGVI